jgi:hypothetical protein
LKHICFESLLLASTEISNVDLQCYQKILWEAKFPFLIVAWYIITCFLWILIFRFSKYFIYYCSINFNSHIWLLARSAHRNIHVAKLICDPYTCISEWTLNRLDFCECYSSRNSYEALYFAPTARRKERQRVRMFSLPQDKENKQEGKCK